MAPRGTTLRNVRIDDERWEALGQAADAEERDRSAVIRELIDEYLMRPPPRQGER